ncbi:hypothetical protein PybrP1_011911 [[Pythium] brassicae (nom. inval.)]|nr:hypothetical protein PybrP1_011911 [[Pythium] brassicae (nom. inval.)]
MDLWLGGVFLDNANGIVVGKWKMGLFSCAAICIPNGCMSLFCPGVSLAQVCARLGLFPFYAVIAAYIAVWALAIISAATNSGVAVALCVIASVLLALFVTRIRWRIRYLFSIPGSVIEDRVVIK